MLETHLNQSKLDLLLSEAGLRKYTVHLYPELNSTHLYAQGHLEQFEDNVVIVCESQTAGIGRNNKTWLNRPYIDLAVSFVHKFPLDFEYEMLPLVIAVAVNRLFKFLRVPAKVKWPNDIWLSDNTKAAGILHLACIQGKKRKIITSVGLNNSGNWERNGLLVNLIKQVDNVISEFKMFGFAIFRREWLDNCVHYNREISLYQATNLIDRGIHIDLTSDGKIVIKDKYSNTIREHSAQAISLRIEG